MGLKTKEITIEGDPKKNRDAGKKFLLTEMPALKAERWARHAIAALNRSDLDAREEIKHLGMLGFYLVGLQALAGGDVEKVDVLMDEMLLQVQTITSANITRPLTPDGGDIEEVGTLFQLRKELIELHISFSFAELALIIRASSAEIQPDLSTTQTSATSSEASSAPTAEA